MNNGKSHVCQHWNWSHKLRLFQDAAAAAASEACQFWAASFLLLTSSVLVKAACYVLMHGLCNICEMQHHMGV